MRFRPKRFAFAAVLHKDSLTFLLPATHQQPQGVEHRRQEQYASAALFDAQLENVISCEKNYPHEKIWLYFALSVTDTY